jgi:hypothetical protein
MGEWVFAGQGPVTEGMLNSHLAEARAGYRWSRLPWPGGRRES